MDKKVILKLHKLAGEQNAAALELSNSLNKLIDAAEETREATQRILKAAKELQLELMFILPTKNKA